VTVKSSHTILIVDDVPMNIRSLAEGLKDEYSIQVASNGKRALEIATSDTPPDLILLDIIMPDLDGFAVCSRLKSDDRTQNIPVIFITSMETRESEVRGLEIGAVDYITKPFVLPAPSGPGASSDASTARPILIELKNRMKKDLFIENELLEQLKAALPVQKESVAQLTHSIVAMEYQKGLEHLDRLLKLLAEGGVS
jgi:PleD family two-component response regulator